MTAPAAMPAPDTRPVAEPSPPRRRRWGRLVLVLLASVVLMVVFAPSWTVPFVRHQIVSTLEEATGARASLGALSLGWGGTHLTDLVVEHTDGTPVLSVDEARASYDLLGIALGKTSASLVVDGLRLRVVEGADGRLDIQDLLPEGDGDSGNDRAAGPGGSETGGDGLPEIELHVDVQDVALTFVAADGRTTELQDASARVHVEGLDEPASFALGATLVGPDGPGGRLAAEGTLTTADDGSTGAASVRGELTYTLDDISLAALAPAARLVAGIEDLTGQLDAGGRWVVDGPLALSGDSRVTLRDLVVPRPDGEALALPRLDLLAEALLDETLSGSQRLSLEAGQTLTLDWAGTTTADGAGRLPVIQGDAELGLDPVALSAWLAPFGLPPLRGERVAGQLRVRSQGDSHGLAGVVQLPWITAELPPAEEGAPARLVGLREGQLLFQLDADTSADEPVVTVHPSSFSSTAFGASVEGRLLPDLELTLRTEERELAPLLASLDGLLSPRSWNARGRYEISMDVSLGDDGLAVATTAEVADLDFELPAEGDEPGLSLSEPSASVLCDLTLAPGGALELGRLEIQSSAVDGTITGTIDGLLGAADVGGIVLRDVRGDLTYVPDRVAEILGPRLPVTLAGSAPRAVAFQLEGPLDELDTRSLLSTLSSSARLELGTLAALGVAASGRVELTTGEDGVELLADLAAGGGRLQVRGDLDPRLGAADAPAPSSRLELTLQGLGASAGLDQLLVHLHPLLATATPLGTESQLGARLDGSLTLDYTAPLPLDATVPPDLDALAVRGRLAVREARLRPGPQLSEMLSALGRSADRDFELQPLAFSLTGGRLRYDEPWQWDIGSTVTTFTGSIGLDRTLDLVWNVPVTEELAGAHRLLEPMIGQVLAVPLDGTIDQPDLHVDDVLAELLGRVARQRVDEELGGLDDVLEGDLVGPEDLLARADALWSEGKKAAAKPLYRRLKDEHPFSLVYQLNKDRIKKRARAKLD